MIWPWRIARTVSGRASILGTHYAPFNQAYGPENRDYDRLFNELYTQIFKNLFTFFAMCVIIGLSGFRRMQPLTLWHFSQASRTFHLKGVKNEEQGYP